MNVLKSTLVKVYIGTLAYFISLNGSAQILKHLTTISLQDGELSTTEEFLIQVNNPNQRSLGEISIPHGQNQNFKITSAEIIDKSGTVVYKLKKKDIIVHSRFSRGTFHQDDLVSEINLFWNEYPYKIHYSYQNTVDEFIYLANWSPISWNGLTPKKSLLSIELPNDFIYTQWSSDEFGFTKKENEETTLLEWELGEINIPDDEICGPTIWERVPSVVVSPGNFQYGVRGNLQNWNHYGDWFLSLNDNKLELTEAEKIKIDSLLCRVDNTTDKINILYHYLQDNTTYINISIDIGGLKSYPASYVCENKYGDCKALTTYMKGLLNYSKIPSNYVLINTGNSVESINEETPGPQFNHIILGVPLDEDTIWLDNTYTTSPTRYVETANQNRKALWLEKGASHLISMPSAKSEEILCTARYTFILDGNGDGEVQTMQIIKGRDFEYLQYLEQKNELDRIKKRLLSQLNIDYFACEDWKFEDRHREQASLEISAKGHVSKQIKKIGDLLFIKPPSIQIPEFEPPIKRRLSVRLRTPLSKENIIIYELSALKNSVFKLPEPIDIISPYGIYTSNIQTNGTQVIVKQKVTIYSGEYPVSEYHEFYDFIHTIKKESNQLSFTLTQP
ncbi:MAG: hypothetical protein AAF600_12315 [Bacteroidota bacterium]